MRRGMALAVMALLALAVTVLVAGGEQDRPVAVVGRADTLAAGTVPLLATATTAAPAPSTTTTRPRAAATRSTTVVHGDAGGITVVNSGSESVNTGNNTVVGPGIGDGDERAGHCGGQLVDGPDRSHTLNRPRTGTVVPSF